jgi:hypothetical protein
MRKLLLLLFLIGSLSGCAIASDSYQPGIAGVRDVPPADFYVKTH